MADSTLTKDGVKRTGITTNLTPGTPYPGAQTSPPVGYFSLWEGNTQVIPDTQWSNGAGPAGTGQAVVNGFTVNGAGSSPVRLNFQETGSTTIPNFTSAVLIINSASNGAPSWGYVDIVDAAIQVPKNAAVENLTFSQTQFYGSPGAGGATLFQNYSYLQNMTSPGSGGPFSYQGLTVACNPTSPIGGGVATSATGTVTAASGAAIPLGTGYFVVVGIGNGVTVVSQMFDVVAAPANVKITQGTSATITLTGPAANNYATSWSITKADGTAIASGQSNPGTGAGTASGGYNVSWNGGSNFTTGSVQATVTVPIGATVQQGDIATISLSSGPPVQGAFDVIPATTNSPAPPRNLAVAIVY